MLELTQEQRKTFNELRNKGYAVVVVDTESYGYDPQKLEGEIIDMLGDNLTSKSQTVERT